MYTMQNVKDTHPKQLANHTFDGMDEFHLIIANGSRSLRS